MDNLAAETERAAEHQEQGTPSGSPKRFVKGHTAAHIYTSQLLYFLICTFVLQT